MMRILVSGICGFVGSQLAKYLKANCRVEVLGIDNLSRLGSWRNHRPLTEAGIQVIHGDVRLPSDVLSCGKVDWVIDAAANPSVLAGLNSATSSRQVVESNLIGTHNLLEHCKTHAAGFILLSSSRVYSISTLSGLPLTATEEAFEIDSTGSLPAGLSHAGISESCSTAAPISLYGATKLCSEALALEYMHAFNFPVWVDRCGILAGAGQFGTAEQGIIAYWINQWRNQQPLKYIGFGGSGLQTRDCLHPCDLARLLAMQMFGTETAGKPRIVNVAGGMESAVSLKQLSGWCEQRWGHRAVDKCPDLRPYDLPWVVLDCTLARQAWHWQPEIPLAAILTEIADFADLEER